MANEVPLAPETDELNPLSVYDAIPAAAAETPAAPAPDLSEYDAISHPAVPDVTTTQTADFSEYDAIAHKDVERTAAEIFGLPPESPAPTPPPDIDLSEYDAVSSAGATERAVDEAPTLGQYDTPLSSQQEKQFQRWKAKYAPRDSGQDYDLRGAFLAGLQPDPETGHWPDTFKKPNHPTFSDQSNYAKDRPDLAGHWEGDQFVPPSKPFVLQSAAQIEAQDAATVREQGPIVPIPKAEITQDESVLAKGAKAAYNTVAGFVEGVTSADGLNMLLNPVVGVASLGSMVPELIKKVREAEKTPANSPERYQAGADVAGFLALPAVIHAARKLRTPARTVEAAKPEQPPPLPQAGAEQRAAMEAKQAEPEPVAAVEEPISQPAEGGGEPITETAGSQGPADLPTAQAEVVESSPVVNELPPELHKKRVSVKAYDEDGTETNVRMPAKEAIDQLGKERGALQALLDCLG